MDVPEFRDFEILYRVRKEVCLPQDIIDEIKLLTCHIRAQNDAIRDDTMAAYTLLRKRFNWMKQL